MTVQFFFRSWTSLACRVQGWAGGTVPLPAWIINIHPHDSTCFVFCYIFLTSLKVSPGLQKKNSQDPPEESWDIGESLLVKEHRAKPGRIATVSCRSFWPSATEFQVAGCSFHVSWCLMILMWFCPCLFGQKLKDYGWLLLTATFWHLAEGHLGHDWLPKCKGWCLCNFRWSTDLKFLGISAGFCQQKPLQLR